MKSSIPVNCLWGSATLLSRGPRSLLAAHWRPGVEPPRMCFPSSPTQAPSEESSMQWSRSQIPVNRHGAQHAPVMRPPFTFGRILQPGFEFSPRARAGPKAAAVEGEGFGLPGVLVMLSTLSYSSQILATRSVAASLRPRSNKRARSPPTFSCCARRQSEWNHCRPRSGLLTWHPSASTADSLLISLFSLLNKKLKII